MDSEIFERDDAVARLENVHGILCRAASASEAPRARSTPVKFARANTRWPFFGICFGMQMAVIEAARTLLGIEDASSSEFARPSMPWSG